MSLIPGVGALEQLSRGAAKAVYPAQETEAVNTRNAKIVLKAAEKWKINPASLWGIFGVETRYGRDVKESSTGAQGPFQFEPATAKEYGYPIDKNTEGITDLTAFAAQADAAAHKLAADGAGKDPRKAIEAYNPGEPSYYGKVARAARTFSGWFSVQEQHEQTTAQTEANPNTEGSIWGKLESFGVLIVLLLAGAVLVIYGIMVAVKGKGPSVASVLPVG